MKTIKRKLYSVDWYYNGFCYRTTTGCTWEDVKTLRKIAKATRDTVKHYQTGTKEFNCKPLYR